MQNNEQAQKRCSTCDEWRALSEYNRNSRTADGLQPTCRACDSVASKARYKNPDYAKKQAANAFRSKYGITWADKRAIFESQGGLCAWCKYPLPDWHSSGAHLDHCHATGLIRGVVHPGCNREIATFEAVHARGIADPVAHFTAYQLAAEFRPAAISTMGPS